MQADEPVRVLQLNAGSEFGGVSSFLYNIYTHIDRNKVQFDFISQNKTSYNIYRQEIEEMGGRIYELGIEGNTVTQKIKLCRRLRRFLLEHDYLIIHINSGSFFFNLFAVKIAKNAGVKYRIVHSHNAGDTSQSSIKRTVFHLLKPNLERSATDLFACSKKAAQYMFTEKSFQKGIIKIIKNGIDIDRFVFDSDIRRETRKNLNIKDKLVLGHVGRFTVQKNHEFLIKIFSEVHKIYDESVLLLCGAGEKQSEIERLVCNLGLENDVYFLGVVNEVEKIYQAIDIFVMPSFHEGLPVACIEVQVMGIPCVLSDTITDEVQINNNIKFFSINESPREWAQSVLKLVERGREDGAKKVKSAGYSIDTVASELQNYYLTLP